ncbi:hypothetical protein ABZP36_024956 [Zizania latifolia]
MQDLSRAPATALCKGISVSSPADAAADLQRSRREEDAKGGSGEPRTRPARGAGRSAVLAAEAAARAKDDIFLETERDEQRSGGCGAREGGGRKWRRRSEGRKEVSPETASGTHPTKSGRRATSGMNGWIPFWVESNVHVE